jgi:excinuclease UvrABC ATPase subunit
MLVPFSFEPLPLNSILLVIEPNLDRIRCGDWVIDPGSEGADKGGEIVVVQHPLEPVVV